MTRLALVSDPEFWVSGAPDRSANVAEATLAMWKDFFLVVSEREHYYEVNRAPAELPAPREIFDDSTARHSLQVVISGGPVDCDLNQVSRIRLSFKAADFPSHEDRNELLDFLEFVAIETSTPIVLNVGDKDDAAYATYFPDADAWKKRGLARDA